MSKEWREGIELEIIRLKQRRNMILELDSHLAYNDLVSKEHRDALSIAIRVLDREIERLLSELIIDDLLSGLNDN